MSNFEQSLAQFGSIQIIATATITRETSMPSLIYISRIIRSSEELAKGLQSAGFHVKSFASGEITADECLLVMTSEAVLTNLRPANVTPRNGNTAKARQESEDIPSPSSTNAHLESQTATWNRLKTAAAKESAITCDQASTFASGNTGSGVKTDLEPEGLGFIASEVKLQTPASLHESETLQRLPVPRSATTGNPSRSPLPLPTEDKSRVSAAQISAVSRGKTSRPSGGRRRVNVPRYGLLWQTVAIATSMLLFAAIRPSMRDLTSEGKNQSIVSDSEKPMQTKSGRRSVATSRTSISPVTPSSAGTPKAAGAQRYRANYSFVAEDTTNHFDPQAHSIATLQSSESKARGSVEPKRIVVVN